MKLKLFNTLSNTKEIFTPIHKNKVSMYVCGVTLYDHIHIGHLKSIITFEILKNYFLSQNHKVKLVRNITDVDDKIINKAVANNQDPLELVNHYINEYHALLKTLEIREPDEEPRVTDYLEKIQTYIAELQKKGWAYEADDGIYFNTHVKEVETYPLSKKVVKDLDNTTRLTDSYDKRHKGDFALWKKDEEHGYHSHIFPSKGRPGWHIECSVMHHHTLGPQFDIHGGGRDLIFPHHENEIIQSEAHNGVNPANYWIHNGMMTKEGKKLSKSEGNSIYVRDLLQTYSKEALKLFLSKGQYNQSQEFNIDEIQEAHERFNDFSKMAEDLVLNPAYHSIWDDVIDALEDDLNTPLVITLLYSSMKELKQTNSFQQAEEILKILKLLSVVPEGTRLFDLFVRWRDKQKPSSDIEALFHERNAAKSRKDFALADEIRTHLKSLGWTIQDNKEGSVLVNDR